MKKIYLLAFFLTAVNSNAQWPCSPWPTCTVELRPITVTPWTHQPSPGMLPPYYTNPESPIVGTEFMSAEEIMRPCPGTPIKRMKIAPSGGWNTRGGTYGYTRSKGKQFHDGIDIAGNVGADIYNMHQGTVTRVENSFSPNEYREDSYGNFVQVESVVNGEKFTLKYNHLNSVANIKVGDKISQGQVMGTLGMTGNAADPDTPVVPHVHIQGKDANGRRIDPEKHLNAEVNKRTGEIKPNCK